MTRRETLRVARFWMERRRLHNILHFNLKLKLYFAETLQLSLHHRRSNPERCCPARAHHSQTCAMISAAWHKAALQATASRSPLHACACAQLIRCYSCCSSSCCKNIVSVDASCMQQQQQPPRECTNAGPPNSSTKDTGTSTWTGIVRGT